MRHCEPIRKLAVAISHPKLCVIARPVRKLAVAISRGIPANHQILTPVCPLAQDDALFWNFASLRTSPQTGVAIPNPHQRVIATSVGANCVRPRYKFLTEFAICILHDMCLRTRYALRGAWNLYHIAFAARQIYRIYISHLRSRYIAIIHINHRSY